jgi:hypothetical protein
MVITPRPFGQVLSDAMNSLTRTWRALLIPALAVSIPVSIATVVVFRLTGGGEFLDTIVNNPEALQRLPRDVFWELSRPFYIAVGISTVLQLISGVFVALASHRAVASDLAGKTLTGGQVSILALRRYARGLVAVLLITLTVAVLVRLGTAMWLAPILAVGTPNATSVLVALILFVVLMGPGTWAAVSVSMSTSVIAVEDTGAVAAIRRSMRLVRRRWWPTLGFLLLVGLFGGIAIQLIQLIALPLAAVGGGSSALTIASALGVLTQGLLVAAISAMYTHWYVDLRSRRETVATTDLG